MKREPSLLKRVLMLRWVIPVLLMCFVLAYETAEHLARDTKPFDMVFPLELAIFGLVGPALVAVALTWIARSLAAQEEAQAQIRHLNASLEKQVADRTRSLEEAYAELEEKNRELLALDRLKSEFISVVSHELRAPLTNINGGIELLLGEPQVPPLWQDALAIVGEESQRLTRLVQTMLDASVIEAGRWPVHPGPVAIPPLVQTAVHSLHGRAGQRRFHWIGSGDLPFVWADEDSLMQVLTNLLNNAVCYSPDGSTITLGAQATVDDVQVWVSDEGPGIPADAREQVFDKYGRLEGRYDKRTYGHGLGLYVARRLVEAQSGRIWIENWNGGGTRFVVSLPRAIGQPTAGDVAADDSTGESDIVERPRGPLTEGAW